MFWALGVAYKVDTTTTSHMRYGYPMVTMMSREPGNELKRKMNRPINMCPNPQPTVQ